MQENQKKKNLKKQKSKLNDYAKYSGIATQMFVIIFAGVFGGIKLDEKYSNDKKIFTPILSILGVFLALYLTIKDLINNSKE